MPGLLWAEAAITQARDPCDLNRFVEAQAASYSNALRELAAGRKETHWMWFIFPQLLGLGQSPTARFYGIRSIEEAQAYLQHPLLGSRLRECVEALQDLPEADAAKVFGTVDALKLRSCLTLFCRAGGGPLFSSALERCFGGVADPTTERLLAQANLEMRND